MKQVNKKIFNIKAWHFWKSFRCFVCSVVGCVARTSIYKYIFVFRQFQCHNGILFPYIHRCFVSPNSNIVFSICFVFSQNGVDLLKSASAVPTLHPPYLRAERRLSLYYHQGNESKQGSIFYAWFVIGPISTKWVGSTIHLSSEFRSKDNISFRSDYKAIICETFTLCI